MNQPRERPLHFSLDPNPQEDEIFIDVAGTKTYKISNLGRVKNIKKSSDKILLAYRLGVSSTFYVKIKGKQFQIKELAYLAFFGEIPKGHKIRPKNGNAFDLSIRNLESYSPEEEKRKRAAIESRKGKKPYLFTVSQKLQKGEIFKPIKGMEGRYEVSNIGRVKRAKHTYEGKNYQVIILSPNASGSKNKFRVKIQGILYNVQDLMLDAFIGLSEGEIANVIDGDNRNLHIDNLDIKKSCHRTRRTKIVKVEKGVQKQITVDLNEGDEIDKANKVKEMNELRKRGYILRSSENGVYNYELKD